MKFSILSLLKSSYDFICSFWIWCYIAIMPIFVTIISPRWFLPNTLIPNIDEWFYTGFFLHFPDFFEVRYFGSRLPWNLFGKITYDIFGPVFGEFVQAIFMFYLICISYYMLNKKYFGMKTASFTVILLSVTLSFYGLISSNYPTAFCTMGILLSYLCVVKSSAYEYKKSTLLIIVSSFLFTLSVITHYFVVIFGVGIFILLFHEYGLNNKFLKRILLFFTGSILTACLWILIGYYLTGDSLLLFNQYIFMLNSTPSAYPFVVSNPLPIIIIIIGICLFLKWVRLQFLEKQLHDIKSRIYYSLVSIEKISNSIIPMLIHGVICVLFLLIILYQGQITIIGTPFYYDYLFCTAFIAISTIYYKQVSKLSNHIIILIALISFFVVGAQFRFGSININFETVNFFILLSFVLIIMYIFLKRLFSKVVFVVFTKYCYIFYIFLAVVILSISFPPQFSSQIFSDDGKNEDAYKLTLAADSYISSFGASNISYLYQIDDNYSFHSTIFHHSHCIRICSNSLNKKDLKFYSNTVDGSIFGEYLYDSELGPILVHLYPMNDFSKKEKIFVISEKWNITLVDSNIFYDKNGGFVIDVYKINQPNYQIFPDPYFTVDGIIDHNNRSIISKGVIGGCIVYGPYAILSPGEYNVSIMFDFSGIEYSSDAKVSIYITEFGIKQSKNLVSSDLLYEDIILNNGSIDLNFSIKRFTSSYEFKIIDFGGTKFKVKNISLKKKY